ncbi:PQQ-binding-like beta-propeller repeat protein [candidate division FCPU426 bacterium]|nr:PQQ-binding-like beta-propeller repeat protein [candidate division FCPU426 bacterium]
MFKSLAIFSILFCLGTPLIAGCRNSGHPDQNSASVVPSGGPAPTVITDWPVFRGDPQLTGNTKSRFPDAVKLLWSFQTKDSIKSSPVVAESTVFIGSNDASLYALDLATGAQRWTYQTNKAVEAPPLYFNGAVFVPSTDGILYALRAKDGTLLWKHSTAGPLMGSANIVFIKNEPFLITGSYDNSLYCLNLQTGSMVWNYPTENFINGAPSVYFDIIVFGGCDSHFHLVSAQSGKKLASLDIGSYVAGSAAIAGSLAIIGNYAGVLTGIDLTKRKIRWTYDLDGSAIFSSPAANTSTVVVGARDKKLHCFDPATGLKRWSFPTRGDVDSSPLIGHDRCLAASTDGWLYCINVSTGKEVWSYQVGAAMTSAPAFAQNIIILGADDGRVYAFGRQEE